MLRDFSAETAGKEVMPVAAHYRRDLVGRHAHFAQSVHEVAEVAVILKPGGHRRKTRSGGTSLAEIDALGPSPRAHPFHHGIRLVLAEIGADCQCTDTHQIDGPGDHLAVILQAAGRAAFEMVWVERKAQDPTAFGEGAQNLVRLVPQGRMPACGVGVGYGDGPRRMVDGIKGRPFARMAHVHDQLHLSCGQDQPDATDKKLRREPGIGHQLHTQARQ